MKHRGYKIPYSLVTKLEFGNQHQLADQLLTALQVVRMKLNEMGGYKLHTG